MMTEREKMLAGDVYDAGDDELLNRWHLAKRLQQQYNQADSRNREELGSILDELLGSHGDNVWVTAPFYVDYGENIHLGNNVEINANCVFLDCNRITIGDNSGIGPGVHIYTVAHPTNPSDRLPDHKGFWKSFTKPVTIGSNVWIGGSSVILPGIVIGDNATIGAGSVVTHDVEPNTVVAGNPARLIKRL
jgi:maltose O-acetyltransferase